MEILEPAGRLLKASADPHAATAMASYMKTDMPFYGVASPIRREVMQQLTGAHPVTNDAEYRRGVTSLWSGESDFFIRKAIRWALRQHSKTDPGAVSQFVSEHRSAMSGLSLREATKYL